jgi:uncharacterized protein involved in outer membrane biogenesis
VKKILIGLGVFVVVVVTAILVVPGFIDWSGYRAEIAQKVKAVTGRDLVVGGDIAFSVLPSPKLTLDDIRFANAEGASSQDMVEIRQLDVRVALLPLLAGNLHVNSIHMIDPTIRLEMLPNGKGNWDVSLPDDNGETLSVPQQRTDPAFSVGQSNDNPDLPIQIDDFIIENGRLIYSDPAQDVYEEVSELNSRFALAGLKGPYEAAGTMKLRGIPVGFETTVGQIVHGRTASFATQIKFAHGQTAGFISGTVVNLADGPKIKTKLDVTGESLAGFVSAFAKTDTLPGGLDRPFKISGDIAAGKNGILFEGDGLDLNLGEDHGRLKLDASLGDVNTLKTSLSFKKIDGDIWLTKAPYKVTEPAPLPLLITPTKRAKATQANRVSASIGQGPAEAGAASAASVEGKAAHIPTNLEATINLNVDAVLLKGDSIRQVQGAISVSQGEVALEQLSALLPGAGELTLVGVAGERKGTVQFDGSMELNITHLRGLLRWAEVDTNGLPADRLQQISLQTNLSATPDALAIQGLSAKMDGTTLKGAANVALQSRPSFGASITVDRLNLDAYLPDEQAPAQQGAGSATGAPSSTSQAATKTSAAFDPVAALKVLDAFDANLDVRLGELTYQKRTIKNAAIEATVYNGGLDIKKASVGDFAGVTLGVSGKLARTDKGVQADNLHFKASGKDLSGAAKIAGLSDALDWQKVGAVALSATLNNNVLAPQVDVSLDALGGSVVLSGQADILPLPKLDATVSAQFASLSRLTDGLGLSYRPTGPVGRLDVNTDLIYTLNQVNLKNLTGVIGKTDLGGEVLYKMGARPYADVALNVGDLILDPLMPVEGGPQQKATNGAGSGASTGAGSTTKKTSGKWSREPIDLTALKSMDAKIRVQAKSVRKDQMVASNVVLAADLKDGVLDLSKATADLFGGKINATSKVSVGDQAQINFDLTGTGLKLSQALRQSGSGTKADGGVSLSAKLATQGRSEWDFVSGLNGNAALDLTRVSVDSGGKGSPLQILSLLAALSGSNAKTGLADVTVKSDMVNGVATLTTAQLTSAIANGGASGTVNLPDWMIDVSGKLNLQQNALVGLLAQKAKMKQEYPFSIRGAMDAPDVKLDTGGLSSGGGLVIPLPDKLEKKGVGNVLRGLLGAGGIKTEAPTAATAPAPTEAPAVSGDGTVAPPPPPPGGSSSQPAPSAEEQLIRGIGDLLRKK